MHGPELKFGEAGLADGLLEKERAPRASRSWGRESIIILRGDAARVKQVGGNNPVRFLTAVNDDAKPPRRTG